MTGIEFHVNQPDKVAYACRLIRKAHRSGAVAVVTGEKAVLEQLDALLWTFSPVEFISHQIVSETGDYVDGASVWLAEHLTGCPPDAVLVNVGPGVPAEFERFSRFFELVSSADTDLQAGRQRWKFYKDRGYSLTRYDPLAAAKA